jgi:hypothetical protein
MMETSFSSSITSRLEQLPEPSYSPLPLLAIPLFLVGGVRVYRGDLTFRLHTLGLITLGALHWRVERPRFQRRAKIKELREILRDAKEKPAVTPLWVRAPELLKYGDGTLNLDLPTEDLRTRRTALRPWRNRSIALFASSLGGTAFWLYTLRAPRLALSLGPALTFTCLALLLDVHRRYTHIDELIKRDLSRTRPGRFCDPTATTLNPTGRLRVVEVASCDLSQLQHLQIRKLTLRQMTPSPTEIPPFVRALTVLDWPDPNTGHLPLTHLTLLKPTANYWRGILPMLHIEEVTLMEAPFIDHLEALDWLGEPSSLRRLVIYGETHLRNVEMRGRLELLDVAFYVAGKPVKAEEAQWERRITLERLSRLSL